MPLTQVQGGMILPSTTLTTPIVATTMGVGGATPAASGSGITFPATQSASTDANTLDDYEEGTWTPTVSPNAGSLTSYTSAGWYTKCGRMVQITGGFLITNAGTASSSANIGNLPFTSFNTTGLGAGNRNSIGAAREDGATGIVCGFFVNPNSTTGQVYASTITWATNYQYTFSVVYFV